MKQAIGDKQGWARQHMEADIWQRISATLMFHVAEQLSASQEVLGGAVLPLVAAPQGPSTAPVQPFHIPNGMPVAAMDMVGWQRASQTEEGAFVGPIRVQCTRPKI